jgi:hypothetical protein
VLLRNGVKAESQASGPRDPKGSSRDRAVAA